MGCQLTIACQDDVHLDVTERMYSPGATARSLGAPLGTYPVSGPHVANTLLQKPLFVVRQTMSSSPKATW